MFWNRLVVIWAALAVVGICVQPCNAAQTYSLYQSTDGGSTWKEFAHPFKSIRVNALHSEGDRIWAGTERGLFVSRDAGKSWRDIGQARLGNVKALASTPEVMVLGTKTGLWRAQKGSDWSQALELAGQYIRSVATDGERFFAGTDRGEVFYSEDKGSSWKTRSEGLPQHAQIFELKTTSEGQLYTALYSRGYFALRNGVWENVSAPYAYTILPLDNSTLIAGGNPGGVVRSSDAGKSWTPAGGLPTRSPTWMLFKGKQGLFVGTSGKSGLYRSYDLGQTWTPVAEKEFGSKAVVAMAALGDVLALATVNVALPEWFDPGRIAGIAE